MSSQFRWIGSFTWCEGAGEAAAAVVRADEAGGATGNGKVGEAPVLRSREMRMQLPRSAVMSIERNERKA